MLTGWNPRNLAGMFDFFGRREIPRAGPARPTRSAEPTGLDAVRSMLAKEAAKYGES
jgi:hypothetical protein